MILQKNIIQFIIMIIIGMLFNPMNVLADDINDLYFSLTLFYGGLLMASNMIWSHEIIHYLSMGHFNKKVFIIGIVLSLFSVLLLRTQLFVDDKQWLKRMIGHHSTALTTTTRLLKNNNLFKYNSKLYRIAKSIVLNQKLEISYMKTML
tara:strand:- start:3865 stop:4311 length:447 start_codon:yes stop_codon:yes gene_type:complete